MKDSTQNTMKNSGCAAMQNVSCVGSVLERSKKSEMAEIIQQTKYSGLFNFIR